MDTMRRAQTVLGDDFISVEDIMSAGLGVYTLAQVKQLAMTIPSRKVLEELKRNDYGLVPQPTSKDFLKLISLREIEYVALPGGQWLAIKKTPVLGSGFHTWCEQLQLLKGGERVPTILEAAWFLLAFRTVRRQQLFTYLLRTSTQDVSAAPHSLGSRHFAVRELRGSETLFSVEDGYAGTGVGLSAAWKL